MSTSTNAHVCSDVVQVTRLSEETNKLDVLIVAAGFEDRAFAVLPCGSFNERAQCILIRFRGNVPTNDQMFKKFRVAAEDKFSKDRVAYVDLSQDDPKRLEDDLRKLVLSLPDDLRRFAVDISGMPSHAICVALKVVRDLRPEEEALVFYAAAKEYVPSFAEYQRLLQRNRSGEIELLPKSMALEMAENLILDSFSGYRSQNAKSCLAVSAGYEVHRSTGVIEAINPALLLLLYGRPGDASISWRLELSQKLHRKFERGRRTATEIVSTLQVKEALDVFEEYYSFLLDDFDMVIAPIGAKMHVVAAYLFWEKYGEVQLTFPIPIGYNPDNAPRGIGGVYRLAIQPRGLLFRGQSDERNLTLAG